MKKVEFSWSWRKPDINPSEGLRGLTESVLFEPQQGIYEKISCNKLK